MDSIHRCSCLEGPGLANGYIRDRAELLRIMKTSQSYAFTQSLSRSLFEVRVVFNVVHNEVAKPALMANDRNERSQASFDQNRRS
jgi:hypothetical protein